jgi:glutathione S-transferase
MKLYYSPGSCALAAHIALSEAKATFEAIRIDFGSAKQRSTQYLATNPKGRVPALVTERGVLTETPAILAYIAQSFPQAELAPLADPFEFAKAQAFNSYLCSTVHVAHAHGGRGQRWADIADSHADMKRKVPETVTACFELIENEFFQGPWVMGESYTVCDPYLYTISRWLEGDSVAIAQFPKVSHHFERITQRPLAKQAIDAHFSRGL